MSTLARSGIGVGLITVWAGCALSHGGPGDVEAAAELGSLEASCHYMWDDTFAETGQNSRTVDVAAELGVGTSCGCFRGGLTALASDEEDRAALDCFCEAARTCTPSHGRAAFFGAETALLFDYFVAPSADGSCGIEVLAGDYSYFERPHEWSRERCAVLTCAEDDRGHLRGSLAGCPSE